MAEPTLSELADAAHSLWNSYVKECDNHRYGNADEILRKAIRAMPKQAAALRSADEEITALAYTLACVADHATGGVLSKTNYNRETYYEYIDDHTEKLCDEAVKEAREKAAEQITKLTERCEAYKGQVKAGEEEIGRLKAGLKREAEAHVAEANARMKAEAALAQMRRMVEGANKIMDYAERQFMNITKARISPALRDEVMRCAVTIKESRAKSSTGHLNDTEGK